MMDRLAYIVAQRWLLRQAADNLRKNVRKLTHPINKPKGIDKDIVDAHGEGVADPHDMRVKPNKTDIRPDDVFAGTPNQMNVLNLWETGKDQQKVLDSQVPKDKGYDVVKNLSQYLIRTDGGGSGDPAGKKLK